MTPAQEEEAKRIDQLMDDYENATFEQVETQGEFLGVGESVL